MSFTSESADDVPTGEELAIVQDAIQALMAQCEKNPEEALDNINPILEGTRRWTNSDVSLWLLLVQARAFRYLSQLADAVASAEEGIGAEDANLITAHLEVEAGMALNEMGESVRAEAHLLDAVRRYNDGGEANGEAWALTALAVASNFTQSFDPEELLERAMLLSDENDPIRAMIWHRRAVVHRHRGQISEALVAIENALGSTGHDHSRANFLLERGHLWAWAGAFSDSDEDYIVALETFLEHHDLLGAGNAERSLAINALRLGRHADGLRRLNNAADFLRQVSNRGGLANVLVEHALVLAGKGDTELALRDLNEAALGLDGSDPIGLAAVHRAFSRVYTLEGDNARARQAIAVAESVTDGELDPLGVASNLLLAAEMATSPEDRVVMAQRAASQYRDLGIPQGEAHAFAYLVEALTDRGDIPSVIEAMNEAAEALHRARVTLSDPGRRADQDYELHPVTRSFSYAANALRDRDVTTLAADHLVELAPLGMRAAFALGEVDDHVRALTERLGGTETRQNRAASAHRPGLQELAAALATLATTGEVPRPSFDAVVSRRPLSAHLFVGHPTTRRELPLAWCIPGGPPQFAAVNITDDDIAAIEGLGRSHALGDSDLLWAPSATLWTGSLAQLFLPFELRAWLGTHDAPNFVVHLPPLLSHVPVEALDLDGVPLGAHAAVSRLCSTTTTPADSSINSTHAFLDPSLPWAPERTVLGDAVADDLQLRGQLGPDRLIHIGCHGTSAPRTEGCLQTADGRCVTDALDLLDADLSGSTVVLEACFSSRHVGHRMGETLDLSTISMLAGASAAIGAIFALPADDSCTGVIVGDLLRSLLAGVPSAEALRRARATYLSSAPESVAVPGRTDHMGSASPWAWAGLVSISR